ncbi:MAG: DUF1189 family protein [Legionella sp.]|nr:DUF1189 family protein [Legionella sp.]
MKKNTHIRGIDRPLFSYFQALYLSFFSSKLYVDVGKRWRGLATRYLFLLMAIVSLPLGLAATLNFRHFLDTEIIEPLLQVPPLHVTQGNITIEKPMMPYEIRNQEGEAVIVIDTREKPDVIDKKTYPALTLAITKNAFLFRLPGFLQTTDASEKTTASWSRSEPETIVQKLSPDMTQVIDFKDWLDSRTLRLVEYFLLFLVYPCFLFFLFIINLLLLLPLGLMGQLFSRLFLQFKLSYKQALRLLIVSFTPYAFLGSVLSVTHLKIPAVNIVLLVLWCGYYIFALRSFRSESNKLVFY